ncbi:MAG: Murein hydrolase activator EnvC precursor [bacterium ADurb.Bin429]|nr:MAG: Murein hydrolase activator EnvC precursor [bacterium ADurb.Bin429]
MAPSAKRTQVRMPPKSSLQEDAKLVHPSHKTVARYRRSIIVLVLVGLLWPSLAMAASPTARKTQLQRKRASIQTRISSVRQKLHATLTRERKTRAKLKTDEKNLRVARGNLQVTTLLLERKKIEVQRASLALASAKQQFSLAQDEVSGRLVALYERGDQGYLDLLLSADDFSDMLERMEFAELLMDQDRAALVTLKERRDKVALHQSQLAEKAKEVARLRQRAAVQHNLLDIQRRQTQGKLSDVRDERHRIESELRALERESNAIASMLRAMQTSSAGKARYNRQYSGGFGGLPVNGRVGSRFGMRYHPILKRKRMHTGVDIGAPSGTPIHAAGAGEVIYAGWRGGYGNTVMIDHGRGRVTLYAHMSSIGVRVGRVVSRGQTIGRVGSTGLSTGPHLHYELRINGTPVNPL